MRTPISVALVLLASTHLATAQPRASGDEPLDPSRSDTGVIDDANSPGAFLSPSALAEPEGTFTASLGVATDTSFKDPLVSHLGVSYSPTSSITISGALLVPTADNLHIGTLTAKAQVMRSGRWRGALEGVLLVASDNGEANEAGLVGGVVSYCLDDGCNSYASGDLGLGIVHSSGSGVPLLVSGSVVAQVAPHFKLVGEILTGQAGTGVSGSGSELFAFYGARITQKNVGVNIGFYKPIGTFREDGPGILFATVTGRVMP